MLAWWQKFGLGPVLGARLSPGAASLPSGLVLVGERKVEKGAAVRWVGDEAGEGERTGEKIGEFASWLMEEQWER